MKNSKLFLIFALFMVLLCCFSAVSASEDVSDDTVAVSDDFAVDEVIGEVDSNDESLSIPDEEILASDDSNNESLEINDVEEVDDVDNSSTALAAEENDVEEVDDVDNSSTALAAEENDDGLSGQSHTVDDNGYIHYASYSSSAITDVGITPYNINPVSSAMTCDEEYLYLGDDAGILWVFEKGRIDEDITSCLSWAFNATSSIGGITVDSEGIVYIGNIEGDFYAIESAE